MGDITLVWDTVNNHADWQVGTGDLVTGNTLQTAIIRSLFTDQRAPADLDLDDPRGVWTDTYSGVLAGSLLWLLGRSKISDSTSLLLRAEGYCNAALAWLVTAGVAATIVSTATFATADTMRLLIVVTEPSGTTSRFKFAYLWAGG
jgi:phage gp46-like protein